MPDGSVEENYPSGPILWMAQMSFIQCPVETEVHNRDAATISLLCAAGMCKICMYTRLD